MQLTKDEQQVLALCGALQCCYLVDQIAQNGQCDGDALEAMLQTLFVTNPESTMAVYTKPEQLADGLKCLRSSLGDSGAPIAPQALRYGLALMHLQRKLASHSDMLDMLAQKLDQTQHQIEHFGLMHENVIASLGGTYQDTISTFNMKIQVSGHAQHLQIQHNAAKIRALLLAGIRSTMLWRQVGGHRWHFIFGKSRLRKAANSLQTKISAL